MRHLLRTTLVVVARALLETCAPSAMGGFPGSHGRIVFATNRDGDYEIYSMNPDGSDQTNLTNDPGQDISPRVGRREPHRVREQSG
jgi:hypothetical protein